MLNITIKKNHFNGLALSFQVTYCEVKMQGLQMPAYFDAWSAPNGPSRAILMCFLRFANTCVKIPFIFFFKYSFFLEAVYSFLSLKYISIRAIMENTDRVPFHVDDLLEIWYRSVSEGRNIWKCACREVSQYEICLQIISEQWKTVHLFSISWNCF